MKRLLKKASPTALFVLGALCVPAFLFQQELKYQLFDGLLFLALAWYSGKRIRLLPALLLLLSVTGAALLVPYGKVLYDLFGFPITLGALKMGFSRSVVLLGLFYLSKVTVTSELILPGKFGHGLSLTFAYLEKFTHHIKLLSVRDLAGSLDILLQTVAEEQTSQQTATQKEKRALPCIIPLMACLFCWSLLLF